MREWREGESCLNCGTVEVLHHARGLCVNCYATWWRERNPNKNKEIQKRYRSTDKWKETEKDYNKSERGKQINRDKTARYREKNKEACLERTHEWRDKNRPHIKRYNDSQRVRKWRNKYGEDAVRILRENDFKCQKCGSGKRVGIHHIDWDETNNTYENFAVLCGSCHSALHKWLPKRLRRQIFDEWMQLPQ